MHLDISASTALARVLRNQYGNIEQNDVKMVSTHFNSLTLFFSKPATTSGPCIIGNTTIVCVQRRLQYDIGNRTYDSLDSPYYLLFNYTSLHRELTYIDALSKPGDRNFF